MGPRIAALAFLTVAWLAPGLRAAEADSLAESLRLLYAGDPIQAAALAEGFLKAHPNSADARVSLAQAKMAVGDFDTAYDRLREAVRIDPKNVDALYHFGKLCTVLAQREHEGLFKMAPDHYRVHQLMAESYLAQQNVTQAEEAYQRALKANPKSVAVLNALGDLKRRELGGTESTLDAPAPSRYDEAITYYSRAVKLDAASYEAHYGLGVSYLNSSRAPEAIDHFRRAVRADPRSAVAHLGLGRALMGAEKPAEAVEELNAAVRLEPRMRQGYFLLGRVYQILGKPDLARQALAKERELRQAEFQSAQDALSAGGVAAPGSPPQQEPDKP
jgi:tetratricopeptide (TPR) repeat protein